MDRTAEEVARCRAEQREAVARPDREQYPKLYGMGLLDWHIEELMIQKEQADVLDRAEVGNKDADGQRGGYSAFIQSKTKRANRSGFTVQLEDIHPRLRGPEFGFQGDIVKWALRLGRAAIWADTGMGKTGMQTEWASHVCRQTKGSVLILSPLAVAPQTVEEGVLLGIPLTLCRQQTDCKPGVNITNYESLHKFDPDAFTGVVLDESSILKSFDGKTRTRLIAAFKETPFKLCCTATPAPNDHMELGNHAEFLGVMDQRVMLSRWFCHDSADTSSWRLKKHAAKDYWRFTASYACSVSKPSDLGYEDGRFKLPLLNLQHHIVDVSDLPAGEDRGGQMRLIRDAALSATNMHAEMRITAERRAQKVHDLVCAVPDRPWLIWVNTDYEADAVMDLVQGFVEVRGSHSIERKEKALMGFAKGDIAGLVTKAKIAGFGMNFQICGDMALTLDYSYEKFYQLIRRCWRFGRVGEVNAHIVAAASEGGILAALEHKEKQAQAMKAEMNEAMRETQLENIYAKPGPKALGVTMTIPEWLK